MPIDETLADRIREVMRGEDSVTEKRMFGGLAFLINGNMAVSASGQGGLLLRVDPAESDSLSALPYAEKAVMRGKEMDGWLRVESEGVSTSDELQQWAKRGITFARSLPPKR